MCRKPRSKRRNGKRPGHVALDVTRLRLAALDTAGQGGRAHPAAGVGVLLPVRQAARFGKQGQMKQVNHQLKAAGEILAFVLQFCKAGCQRPLVPGGCLLYTSRCV